MCVGMWGIWRCVDTWLFVCVVVIWVCGYMWCVVCGVVWLYVGVWRLDMLCMWVRESECVSMRMCVDGYGCECVCVCEGVCVAVSWCVWDCVY